MRKLLLLIAVFCLFCTGCGRSEEADPNRITGIYARMLATQGTEYTNVASGIVPVEDGYGYLMVESNHTTMSGEDPYWQKVLLVRTDAAGEVLSRTEVDPVTESNRYTAGERGVYTFALTENGRELFHIGWDGTILHRAETASFKPGSAGTQIPEAATILTDIPLRETEDGLVLVWGKRCVLLDENLTKTGEIELPGTGDMVFPEEDILWITYQENGVRTLGKAEDGVITESWPMPEQFMGINTMYWMRLIDCRDGWLYGWSWNSGQVIRWQFGAEEETVVTVLDFMHSGISGHSVRLVTMLPDGTFSIQSTTDDGHLVVLDLYEKAPDKDLSQMTVLTLACVQMGMDVERAVQRFNMTHPDAYIKVVSYGQYNTAEEPVKGYNLLKTDLTTGLLQADILLGEVHAPMDLYPLMTGEVQKEDIAPCVRHTLEQDGKLVQIGAQFTLDTLVGRADALQGMTRWDLDTFLDFAGNLPEGEYLMEEVARSSASYMLFRHQQYAAFIRDGQAFFDDPLYTEYLQFLMTLPEQGQKYMDHGTDNTAQLIAGEITMDQLQVEQSGENLYWNGKIKLVQEYMLQSVTDLLSLRSTFDTAELSFIGYPTTAASGVRTSVSNAFCIPETCRDPALAWEFIEGILLDGAQFAADTDPDYQTLRWNTFSTLYKPYLAYLESLKGLQIFEGHSYGTWVGRDLALDENGNYNGQPGTLQEIDDAVIACAAGLFESAGSFYSVPDAVFEIIYEEESRYLAGAITAEECADIVQSRVSIYLAENA